MKKNILILGAKSDIAQATAYVYAESNYTITLSARAVSDLAHLKSDIELKYDTTVNLVEFDALDYASHRTFIANLNISPNTVLCAFGYLGKNEIARKDFSEAKQILEVNFLGAVSILNEFANYFEEKKEGCIIGISSVAGERGRQSNYFYGSAKAGFTAYLSGLRNRLVKSNVHTATILPGFVNTKMTEGLPLPGLITAQAQDVAKAIFKADKNKKNVVYTLWMWKWIMLIIKSIPEFIFKKLGL